MTLLHILLVLAISVVLLVAVGLLLGADGVVLALIGLLTAAVLLQTLMGGDEAAPHTLR